MELNTEDYTIFEVWVIILVLTHSLAYNSFYNGLKLFNKKTIKKIYHPFYILTIDITINQAFYTLRKVFPFPENSSDLYFSRERPELLTFITGSGCIFFFPLLTFTRSKNGADS